MGVGGSGDNVMSRLSVGVCVMSHAWGGGVLTCRLQHIG